MPYNLILLRHGRSTWNEANLFTGWVDVPLSSVGRAEATHAGTLLTQHAHLPDIAHTSLLRRARDTATLALTACSRADITLREAWQLNERHYGALQGRNKAQAAEEFGEEQVHIWRRSYAVRPPALSDADAAKPENADTPDGRFAKRGVAIPRTECLEDVVRRVWPYWQEAIVPDLRSGRTVLVAAHGNSLRALIKNLEGIGEEEITELEIPTGVPIWYELEEDGEKEGELKVVSNGGKGLLLE